MNRFIKLDNSGNLLSDFAESWSLVRDNDTKLIWEVKTDDTSIHDKNNIYNWHESQEVFIPVLNAEKFGGFNNWRLPTREELISITDVKIYNPTIDTAYFPNTIPLRYWTSTIVVYNTTLAWSISFYGGNVGNRNKLDTYYVRAVRNS